MKSPMAVTHVVSSYFGSPDDKYPIFTMECPRCGNMIYTNANSVAAKLKDANDE